MIRKLTDDLVEGLTGDRKRQQLFAWDKDTAGLGVRITSTGKKSWVFRYSLDGRERRMTLDAYPDMDLTAARQRVAELRQQVERREDPARESPTATREGTLGDLWRKVEAKHLPKKSRGHAENMRDHFERLILPRLEPETLVAELSWEDVDDWLQEMSDTPATARLALASLRKALNLAKSWGMLARGMPNAATDHELPKGARRRAGRAYTDAELKRIGKAVKQEPDPVIRAAMTVYLLTPLRPVEVCRLRWEDLEEGGVVRLDGKTGERYAMLPTPAEATIRELPRCSEYIFPGRRSGEPLGGWSRTHGLQNAWRRVAELAKLKRGRCYDARHTWISIAGGLGIGDDVRRVLAGHASANGAHGGYMHAGPVFREAADRVAEELAEKLGL